jgi:hypothetical protein
MKYKPCLQRIMSFYHNLSEEKKTITIYWVKELVKLSTNDGFAVRLPVHVDKFVFYSPFIWRILQLTQMYSLDVYKRLSLVYMCILSESPDIFIKVTNNLLKDKTFWGQECDDIATKLYSSIWEIKITTHHTPGQRHAPTVNKKGTLERVTHSLKLMAALHLACKELSMHEKGDMYYFNKAIAIFSDSNYGVFHAGGLLSQHLLIIGAACGIYPIEFTAYGEICETKTKEGLHARFGLFSDSSTSSDESKNILKALSHLTGKSVMYCENLVCKEFQSSVSKTNT